MASTFSRLTGLRSSMTFFLSLPSDLQQGVLGTWLGLDEVVRIDSACCCRARSSWLAALYSPTYSYVHPDYSSSPLEYKSGTVEYMRWIMKRSVRVLAIYISEDLAREARFANYLVENGRYVESLAFHGVSAASTWQKGALGVVFAQCANVTKLVFGNFLNLDDCDAIVSAWPRLQGIALPDCGSDVPSHLAAGLLHLTAVSVTVRGQQADYTNSPHDPWLSFSENITPNLRYFSAPEKFSDEALLALLARSHELRALRGKFFNLGDYVLEALTRHCPLLEMLNISSPFVTTQGLITLSQECRKLTSLSVYIESNDVLKHFPALQTLQVTTLQAASLALLHVGQYCPLLVELSVRSYLAGPDDCSAAVAAVGKGCHHLQILTLRHTPPTDSLLIAIGSHFPSLAVLSLSSIAMEETVTYIGVSALAQGCPKLCELRWTLPDDISMAGIDALATHCPDLRKLKVGTTVKEAVGVSMMVGRMKVTAVPTWETVEMEYM